jgi:hypothetical protein
MLSNHYLLTFQPNTSTSCFYLILLVLVHIFLRAFIQATTLIAIMSPRCNVCADLKDDESGKWPFSTDRGKNAPTLEDIRSSSLKCQSGGCRMLLKAIDEFYPYSSSIAELVRRTVGSTTGAVFGEMSLEHKPIELYVTHGRVSHQR